MKSIILTFMLVFVAININAAQIHKLDFPTRNYSVILTKDGFSPDKLIAYEGEKLHINLTATATDKGCLFLRSHNVFIPAQKGKINHGVVELHEAGEFEFYCPSVKFKGKLTVLEKPIKENSRSVASEKPEVDYWLPRDYD